MSAGKSSLTGFDTVFGDSRGPSLANTIFAKTVSARARIHYKELARGVKEGELFPAIDELMTHPQLMSSRVLASSLRDLIVKHVLITVEDIQEVSARLIGENMGLRRQQSENVVKDGGLLHLWDADHGTWQLSDLDGPDITTVCGRSVWNCKRVGRGSWRERRLIHSNQGIARCRVCELVAADYSDCSETNLYPPLAATELALLRAHIISELTEAFACESSCGDATAVSQKLHTLAADAHLDGVRSALVQETVGNKRAHIRILSLGDNEYFELARELEHAGVNASIENILSFDDVLQLSLDLHSSYDFACDLGARILDLSGVKGMYARAEVPVPSWSRA
jgi:hypothetical protein